jgi:hypothetical protein
MARPAQGPGMDPTTTLIRRMVRSGRIEKVTILARERGALASAVPSPHHPLVNERRQAAFAKLGGSVTLAQAVEIGEQALEPVATGRGPTILAAVQALAAALKGMGE